MAEKPADTKPADTKTEQPPATVDVKTLKLPEGFSLTDESAAPFVSALTDDKLSPQDRAQKLIDLHHAEVQKAVGEPSRVWNETLGKWESDVAADKTFGSGDKANPLKPEAKAAIGKLIDAYGGNDLREALIMTGAGSHPAMVRAFYQMAQKLVEGGHVAGNGPSPQKPQGTGASALYPDLPAGT